MQKIVESNIHINSSPRDIIAALIEKEHLTAWWGVDSALIEKKDGGLYTLTWMKSKEGIKFVSSGRIKFYDPRSHLHLEDLIYVNCDKPLLGPFWVKYNVELDGTGSHLTVIQGGFKKDKDQEWYYNSVLDGWPSALVLLKKYLEKKKS